MKSGKPEQTGEKKDKKEERRKKASEGKVGGGTQVYINQYFCCMQSPYCLIEHDFTFSPIGSGN